MSDVIYISSTKYLEECYGDQTGFHLSIFVILHSPAAAAVLGCSFSFGSGMQTTCIFSMLAICLAVSWDDARMVIEKAILNRTFPGAVALVGNSSGIVFAEAFGKYTYGALPPRSPSHIPVGIVPPMEMRTLFDMASCTKVIATTSAIALMYQSGYLSLDDKVASADLLGPQFARNGKTNITVRHLLLHNAGFPPDPEPEWWDPSFGCRIGDELSFDCGSLILESLLNQTLDRPVANSYVYSDLSFITLMYVVGQVALRNNLVRTQDLLPACTPDVDTGSYS